MNFCVQPLATLCRFDHPGNRTADLPHEQLVRLTTELTDGTGPEIESKPPAPISMCLTTAPTGWLAQLKILTSQAEHLLALQPFSSKNVFCAETLSCPAIAVENNRFMTSHHNSSFTSAHWLYPGLHFE